jgi:hypothetical protein
VNGWLAKHPRFHLHFTPTSASRLNLVERFLHRDHEEAHLARHLHQRRLQAAILDYLSAHNANPKPFVWTKNADVILEKNVAPSKRSKMSKARIKH